MIELERHIEILLLDNDCVIVPALGGFMAHHVEARYDEEDRLFLPPLRTIGFNPQLKLNDSLLAQSYVEAYDISYPEALRRIEQEVEELKQHLDNEGTYELNDIGTLSINDEGNITFEPCEAGILTPSLYGLSSFELNTLAETNKQKADEEKTTATTAVDKTPVSPLLVTDETTDDADDTIKIKVSWIRNAVAVAAAIVAFFIFATPVTNSTQSDIVVSNVGSNVLTRLAPKEMAKGEVTVKQDDIKKAINAADTLTSAKATKDVEQKADTAVAPKKPYCIVMASHVSRKGADDYVKQLYSDGYDSAQVYVHNKIVRVIYGNYETEDDAQKQLRKLRDNDRFAESWVYKKK